MMRFALDIEITLPDLAGGTKKTYIHTMPSKRQDSRLYDRYHVLTFKSLNPAK